MLSISAPNISRNDEITNIEAITILLPEKLEYLLPQQAIKRQYSKYCNETTDEFDWKC